MDTLVSMGTIFDQPIYYVFLVRDTDNSDLGSLAPSTATFTNYDVKSQKSHK